MNPSPDAIAAIRAHVTTWASQTDAEILAALNALTIDDPAPQGMVAPPVYESLLLSMLTDPSNGSVVKLINWPNFGLLKSDIESGNIPGVGLWCQALAEAQIITAGESGAITSYISTPIPDPHWPAKLSWAIINIGRPLDLGDIAASRPGA